MERALRPLSEAEFSAFSHSKAAKNPMVRRLLYSLAAARDSIDARDRVIRGYEEAAPEKLRVLLVVHADGFCEVFHDKQVAVKVLELNAWDGEDHDHWQQLLGGVYNKFASLLGLPTKVTAYPKKPPIRQKIRELAALKGIL